MSKAMTDRRAPTKDELARVFRSPVFLIWADAKAEAPKPNVIMFGSAHQFLHKDGLDRYERVFRRAWRRGLDLRVMLALGSKRAGNLLEILLTKPEDFEIARQKLKEYRPGRYRISSPR